ncbi:MAG: hypothetical protein HY700_11325 [Gemmatimonadetes bacterium]|nr:hypothetical protein [Gemmatimonadota bacterium]
MFALQRIPFWMIALAGIVACSNDPTGAENLTIDFSVSPEHAYALSNQVTFTVLVEDADRRVVTDFDTLAVEYRVMGATGWKRLTLQLQTGLYQASRIFTTSGEQEARVVGRRVGSTGMAVLHQPSQSVLHVMRWYTDQGNYRIEFESTPGDIKVGDAPVLKFWIWGKADAAGVRPPVTGLTAVVHCHEDNGMMADRALIETAPGVYETNGWTFQTAGGASANLRFTAADGSTVRAKAVLTVAP